MTDVFRFINLACGVLVAGGTFFSIWALMPVLRSLPPREGLELHRLVSHRVERYMPAAGVVAGLSAIGALVADRDIDAAWVTLAAGLAVALLNIGVAFTFDIPVTKQLNALSADNFSETEYRRLTAQWDRYHLVRAFFGFGAVALFIVSALLE